MSMLVQVQIPLVDFEGRILIDGRFARRPFLRVLLRRRLLQLLLLLLQPLLVELLLLLENQK
jgi:hypothetical protein